MDYRGNQESTLFSNKLVLALSYVIIVAFISLAISTFTISTWYQPQQAYLTQLNNEGVTTSGTITEIEVVIKRKSTRYSLSINFTTGNNDVINIRRDGSRDNFVDQQVDVIYLPNSPEQAEIKGNIPLQQDPRFFSLKVSIFVATWIFIVMCIFGNIRKNGRGASLFASSFPTSASKRRTIFLKSLFAVLAQITKADGMVKDEEVATMEKISQKIGLSQKEYEKMMGHFNAVLNGGDENLNRHLSAFAKAFKHDRTSQLLFLRYLFTFAAADKSLQDNEKIILENTAKILNISSTLYNNLLNEFFYDNQSSNHDWHVGQTSTRKDYDLLGISPNCSDEEIKKAYRAFVIENHPDKLLAKGIPPQALKCANEHFAQIQNAYDQIRKIRGIS